AAIRRIEQDAIIEAKNKELNAIRERTNSIQGLNGYFYLKAPQFPVNENAEGAKRQWQVLTSDFRENLGKGAVRPSDPIMRLGYTEGSWEIELKIPQKHIGQVLSAYDYLTGPGGRPADELDVDLILRNDPTRTFKGKLHRDRIGGEAREHRDDNNEPEPVVFARIRIDGDDIPEHDQLP